MLKSPKFIIYLQNSNLHKELSSNFITFYMVKSLSLVSLSFGQRMPINLYYTILDQLGFYPSLA